MRKSPKEITKTALKLAPGAWSTIPASKVPWPVRAPPGERDGFISASTLADGSLMISGRHLAVFEPPLVDDLHVELFDVKLHAWRVLPMPLAPLQSGLNLVPLPDGRLLNYYAYSIQHHFAPDGLVANIYTLGSNTWSTKVLQKESLPQFVGVVPATGQVVWVGGIDTPGRTGIDASFSRYSCDTKVASSDA